jgi:hypothetical protein
MLGYLPQEQDAIGAQRDMGESSLQLACEPHSHSQRIAEKGVGVNRPRWGKEFSCILMLAHRGQRAQESRREMAATEKVARVLIQIFITTVAMKGHATAH